MNIDEIEILLAGRGNVYSSEAVREWLQNHGQIVPRWFVEWWTSRAIFEANMWVYDEEETNPFDQISGLVLKGPGDDWRDEQAETWDRQYFSLALWQGDAHWVIARTNSTDPDTPIWSIDHECANDLAEMMAFDSAATFQQLLDRVVDWPILRAIDRWRELADRSNDTIINAEDGAATERSGMQAAREELIALECAGFRHRHITRALRGEYRAAVALEEFQRELPRQLRQTILAEKHASMQRWEAAGIGPLPHYEEDEIPAALRYVWEWLEWYPLGPWKLHWGASLLHTMSSAFQQGIPRHLFVISAAGDEFIAMNMQHSGEFGECPIVAWPSGKELSPSLGEWLIEQLT